jgi:hypothetical protein
MGSVPGSSISRKGLFSPADAANISRESLLRLRDVGHPGAVFLPGPAFSDTRFPPKKTSLSLYQRDKQCSQNTKNLSNSAVVSNETHQLVQLKNRFSVK